MADTLAAKKRYTPPPSIIHNSTTEGFGFGNQYRQNFSSQMISDKVITIFSHRHLYIICTVILTHSSRKTVEYSILDERLRSN